MECNADFLNEALKHGTLTKEDEQRLLRAVRDGTPDEAAQARERLFAHNLKFILRYANRFSKRLRSNALDVDDLFQEGAIGELRALQKFDPRKGVRHSTYSGHWVRQEITRAIKNRDFTIRVPVYTLDAVSKIRRAQARFVTQHARMPTEKELVALTGMRGKTVKSLMHEVFAEPVELDKPACKRTSSLFNGDADALTTLKDLIEDPGLTPEDLLEKDRATAFVRSLLAELSQPYGFVVEQCFLNDGKPSLKKIAEKMHERGLTPDILARQQVQRIKSEGMTMLRGIVQRRERECELRMERFKRTARTKPPLTSGAPEEAPVSRVMRKAHQGKRGSRRRPHGCPDDVRTLVEGLEEPYRTAMLRCRVQQPRASTNTVATELSDERSERINPIRLRQILREAMERLKRSAPPETDFSFLE